MSQWVVLECPDGHWRRVIFSVGPFIADYPEQVYLTVIVSLWCSKSVDRSKLAVHVCRSLTITPRCFSPTGDLEGSDVPRSRALCGHLSDTYEDNPIVLCEAFGIVGGVTVRLEYFHTLPSSHVSRSRSHIASRAPTSTSSSPPTYSTSSLKTLSRSTYSNGHSTTSVWRTIMPMRLRS